MLEYDPYSPEACTLRRLPRSLPGLGGCSRRKSAWNANERSGGRATPASCRGPKPRFMDVPRSASLVGVEPGLED